MLRQPLNWSQRLNSTFPRYYERPAVTQSSAPVVEASRSAAFVQTKAIVLCSYYWSRRERMSRNMDRSPRAGTSADAYFTIRLQYNTVRVP
jgi:hypothetical protein